MWSERDSELFRKIITAVFLVVIFGTLALLAYFVPEVIPVVKEVR